MTIGAGNKISAADYNNVRTTFLQLLGTGTGDVGYGQTPNSTAVASGVKVKKSDWDKLRSDINRMATHQGTAIPALTSVALGSKVRSDVLTEYSNVYNTLLTNRFALASGQFSDESLTTSTRTTGWNTIIRHYFNLNFGSYNNARFFFNAGGQVRIKPTFTRADNSTLNLDWQALIDGVPTLVFTHTTLTANSTSGTLLSNIGFYDVTTSAQQIYTRTGGIVSGAATYNVNDYTVRVYGNASQPSIIYFECEFKDDKTRPDPLFPAGDENVTGTVTNTVRMYRPTETVTGTSVVVAAPTTTVTLNL